MLPCQSPSSLCNKRRMWRQPLTTLSHAGTTSTLKHSAPTFRASPASSNFLRHSLSRESSRKLRLLHSVVNNSCGFNPQRKVVTLIFSAARSPGLLEEICWQFAAGLPAFSSLPFFRTQTPTCLQSWLHFRTPGKAPKKGPCPSFQDSVPIGEEFGAQIWGPDLGPNFGAQIWAHLAMLFWLLVCARRACNSPNKYALPRGGRAGCGRDICLMDQ